MPSPPCCSRSVEGWNLLWLPIFFTRGQRTLARHDGITGINWLFENNWNKNNAIYARYSPSKEFGSGTWTSLLCALREVQSRKAKKTWQWHNTHWFRSFANINACLCSSCSTWFAGNICNIPVSFLRALDSFAGPCPCNQKSFEGGLFKLNCLPANGQSHAVRIVFNHFRYLVFKWFYPGVTYSTWSYQQFNPFSHAPYNA